MTAANSHGQFIWRFCLALFAAAIVCIFLEGCTWRALHLQRAETKADERTRELVQGAGAANAVTVQASQTLEALARATGESNLVIQSSRAVRSSSLAASQLNRAQGLIGLPAADQTSIIEQLLSENLETRQMAERRELARSNQESQWITERNRLMAQLREYGTKYEAERNKHIISRIWQWGIGTFGLAGFIAICVFCPAIGIPVITRLIAWSAELIPAAGRIFGVVGSNTLAAVTAGVDAWSASAPAEQVAALKTTISTKMDSGGKKVVKAIRATQAARAVKAA